MRSAGLDDAFWRTSALSLTGDRQPSFNGRASRSQNEHGVFPSCDPLSTASPAPASMLALGLLPMPVSEQFRLSNRELAEALEPYIGGRHEGDDASWAQILEARAARVRRSGNRSGPSDEAPIPADADDGATDRRALEWFQTKFAVEAGEVPYEWGANRFFARSMATSRLHVLAFARLIELLKPARVLEVGCGSGINVLTLSCLFPSVAFHGIDVSGPSVRRGRAVQRLERLPAMLETFLPEPVIDATAHRRVRLLQADARCLPFGDGRFDLVFSRLALERMQSFHETALGEIRRVTRGHVAMIEAFREWNTDGLRRDYIVAHRYFDGAVADLPRFGLEPVLVFDDLPHKVTHRPVLVVARPTAAAVVR